MESENDKVFAPLLLAVRRLLATKAEQERVIADYMFMHEEGPLFAYKHIWSREYVYVNAQGAVQKGEIDTKIYTA